jgi:hypothetical protein
MQKCIVAFLLLLCISSNIQAQDKIKQQLFYYSPKGLSFIPPLSKPAIVCNGKMYLGRKQLGRLFDSLKDDRLNRYFEKYKANKTPADILSFTGSVALPIINIFVSSNAGKINWPLLVSSMLLSGTSSYLNFQAQKHLLYASLYYDNKMNQIRTYVPQQQSIGFSIPLTK